MKFWLFLDLSAALLETPSKLFSGAFNLFQNYSHILYTWCISHFLVKMCSFSGYKNWVTCCFYFPNVVKHCLNTDSLNVSSIVNYPENKWHYYRHTWGLPWWLRWWRICLQYKTHRFNPWLGWSSREGNGNPLFPMDRAWQAMVHRVSKSWTWLSDWLSNTHTHTYTIILEMTWWILSDFLYLRVSTMLSWLLIRSSKYLANNSYFQYNFSLWTILIPIKYSWEFWFQ